MSEHLFPVPRPASGDERFTFSLALDVADVLASHGYPDIGKAFAGHDFVNLQSALFRFLYGPGPAQQSSVDTVVDAVADTVPCGFECGYQADSETDLDDHESHCDHTWPEPAVDLPPSRPVPRRVLRPRHHPGGDLR